MSINVNEPYLNKDRPLKYHELDMLEIIANHFNYDEPIRVLDLGCADGLFMQAMKQKYKHSVLVGVELDDNLIQQANDRFASLENVKIIKEDVIKFDDSEKYDVIIASGIMTHFDEPFYFLDKYTDLLSSKGKLIIYGRFNSFPINSKFLAKEAGGTEWKEERVSYYTGEISDYIEKKGYKCDFQKFNLPIKLEKRDNPFASYTVTSEDGENVVLCGANVVIESFFCTIGK